MHALGRDAGGKGGGPGAGGKVGTDWHEEQHYGAAA